MSKLINDSRKFVLPAIIAGIIILGAFTLIFAQGAPKFKAGDRVKNPDHDAPATVVKAEPGWITVKYDDMPGEFEIMPSGLTLLGAKGKPVSDNKAASPAETAGAGEFKVGDRVKVTISGLQGEENLQPCTIVRSLESNQYGVRCDPWRKLSYMDYNVLPDWVHPWAGASAAPQFDCSFDTPAGTISNNAAPSAQLFERVIYERLAADEKARLGLQFTTFRIGTPFKNVMTGDGLLKDMVPENAIIYPVKTQFKTCKEGTLDVNFLRTTKENFGCYKDRFGGWVCGTDSTPEFLDEQDVPKNP